MLLLLSSSSSSGGDSRVLPRVCELLNDDDSSGNCNQLHQQHQLIIIPLQIIKISEWTEPPRGLNHPFSIFVHPSIHHTYTISPDRFWTFLVTRALSQHQRTQSFITDQAGSKWTTTINIIITFQPPHTSLRLTPLKAHSDSASECRARASKTRVFRSYWNQHTGRRREVIGLNLILGRYF